jgi:hypothetical protein
MRILFFFVHPSKYHLFKYTINYLKSIGYQIDVAIISKDVLEDLVINEGWDYVNIFPEGRRSKHANWFSILLATGINFFKTLWRLHKLTRGKNYDLYVTDDCLTITGKIRKTPSIFFTDNEFSTVPESRILCYFANEIVAPECVKLGNFEHKKIGFNGYKELAYLHPEYFTPDVRIKDKYNLADNYAIIRIVSMTASHDRGLDNITDNQLREIIDIIEKKYCVYICPEKKISKKFEKYILSNKPEDILTILSGAEMFIGDSGTMASEAAILGIPTFMIHDFIGRLSVMTEKEKKYGLMFGYRSNDFNLMLDKIRELVKAEDVRKEWSAKRIKMLLDTEDVNKFLISNIRKFQRSFI